MPPIFKRSVALALGVATAQQAGTQAPSESHPSLNLQTCDESGCTSESKSIVLDSNWRWTDQDGVNCYTGNTWDETICPDGDTCAQNCALEGGDYEGTYGIKASGSSLEVDFVTHGTYGDNVGSRSYMMNSEDKYEMFMLKNREFTFDVDVSQLPCGLNGALYFVAMDEDGGASYSGNNAGAKYGTGYCDAQCPHDMKYINGKANSEGWVPDANSANSGKGTMGSCCFEMDIWEANSVSQAVTPHTCSVKGQYTCEGTECGDNESGDRDNGVCDKDGCDFASFRLGNETFFGAGSGFDLDSTQPMTVVTQFITDDGTDNGKLVEIRREYVQNGQVVHNPMVDVDGTPYDSITEDFCTEVKDYFGDDQGFSKHGGLSAMGDQMESGMVLVLSLWDDYSVNMLWLDSDYPTDADPSTPGVHRGTCDVTSGDPTDVETNAADSKVTFSNIKIGTIGSTYASNVVA
jgi:cellulose 1,4-beta-cellobiosidase